MDEFNYIDDLAERYPDLGYLSGCILAAVDKMAECYKSGGKILICGNGGSAADAEHISGELLKGFMAAPWVMTTPQNRYTLMDDAERMYLARKELYPETLK